MTSSLCASTLSLLLRHAEPGRLIGVFDRPAGTSEAVSPSQTGELNWRRQALAVSAEAVLASVSCGRREILTTATLAGSFQACRVPAMQPFACSAARGLLKASDSAELLRASLAPVTS